MKLTKIILFYCFILFVGSSAVFAIHYRDSQEKAKITAAMVTNLCLFTEWPQKDEPYFNIAVVGSESMLALKGDFESLKLKGKPVKFYTWQDEIDFEKVNAVYIGENIKKEYFHEIMKKCADLPILTISPRDSFIENDGVVKILTQGNRIQFQVSKRELKKRKLVMRSHVLKLADKVIY